jgi:hypothetical protein
MFATQSYRHCLETERLLMADLRKPDTTPAARAQLARALDCILERKRILRMKPAPKPIDVSVKAKRRSYTSYAIPLTADIAPSPDAPSVERWGPPVT